MTLSDLYFNCFDGEGREDPYVIVTSKEIWDKEHCLDEGSSEWEIINKLNALGLYNFMESHYEFYEDPQVMRERLLDAGLTENTKMTPD